MPYTLSIESFILEYHGNLRLFGINTRYLRFDYPKVQEWFLKEEPLFALFLKTENRDFPKTKKELYSLFHLLVYRSKHERFVYEKREFLENYLKDYPTVLTYYKDLVKEKQKSPYRGDYPLILERTALKNLLREEWLFKMAPRVFTFDIARKTVKRDIFDLLDYATEEIPIRTVKKDRLTLKSIFSKVFAFIRSCFVSFY